jgi:hypothetical protein
MAGADDDTSPLAAAARLRLRADRLDDLTPATEAFAIWCDRQTAEAFESLRSPAGEDWPPLAARTIARRAAKVKGANRRSKATGKLTKGAKRVRKETRLRAQGFATAGGGNIKPLWDTGRLRQSIQHLGGKDRMTISAVVYISYHVTGSLKVANRPPQRNPLVIQKSPAGDGFALIPIADERFRECINSHVLTGRVKAA